MEDLPLWLLSRVCLCEVHEVSVDVDGYHELLVIFDRGEGGVTSVSRGTRASDEAPSDWGRVIDRASDVELFIMSVTEGGKADDMLVSVHNSFVSKTKLMKTVICRNMCDNMRKSIIFL